LELEEMNSIDGDELFLKIGLTDSKAKADLADAEEFNVMLTEDLYKKQKQQIPTDNKKFEGEKGTFESHAVKDLDGEAVNVTFPAWQKFASVRADKFQEVGQLDCIRLVRRRITKFIHVDELIKAEIATKMFPVHHWDEGVDKLHRKGWNDLWKIFQWPSEERSDLPNAYFGPELGFFFHWYSFMTRYLVVPAVLSIATFTLRAGQLVDRHILNYCSMGFAVMLVIWSSVFVGHYRQAKHLKQMKWGMEHMTTATLVVRKQFRDAYRDSVRDYLQHIFHWTMVVFMITETLVVVAWVSELQMKAAKDPEGTTYGISNVNLVSYPKYIITINIKLVDKVWGPISNKLSNMENWRSVQELQENMVVKMFIVKMFVFYYPFVYEIVIKPMTTGCGGDNPHTDLTGCVDSMNTNLMMFFCTQVVTEVALIMVGLGLTWWSVRKEKEHHPNKEYTYIELQAKTDPYDEDTLTSDFLNAVITYGYIILFGVSLPFMCCLAFVTNLLMLRLLAYKMSFAYQRPMPKGMDGIGAWEAVIKNLGYLGVATNAYIALFTLKAFREESIEWKLLMFIVVQNVGMALKVAVEALIAVKSTAQMRIAEYNTDVMDSLMDEPDPRKIGSGKESKITSPYA